jgi:glycosyltransferase involved in cell wall biosynthesis
MNILYLTQYFPPDKGAAQIRACEMVQNLSRLGHKVTVVTEFPNHPLGLVPRRYRFKLFQREMHDGIEVIRSYVKASAKKNFSNRIMFYASFMVASVIASLKLKRRYDLVYATSSPLFVGLSGFVISRLKGMRFVFEVRDLWPDAAVMLGKLKNRQFIAIARWIEKLCYAKCNKVVVVTKGCRKNLLEKKVKPQRIELVYNGANVEMLKPAKDGQRLKERYGYKGKFVILYAGNFGLIHGMSSLTEVVRMLAGEGGIQFIFIGEGPMKSEVLCLREKYRLMNLKILNDIPREKIVDYLNLADVCLVSAKRDDLSRVLLPVKMFDAWACGRPIVLSVDGEAREHLEKAEAGLWAEPENPYEIARAIKCLFDNPQLCKKYGSNGRRYVKKHFSRKVQAERLEKILLEVCGEKTR